MENLFFLGTPEAQKASKEEVLEIVNEEICGVGVCPTKVFFGRAVYPDAPIGGEVGAIVYVDEPKLAFHTAFALKERLRVGTYQILLDESSLPNVNFKVMLNYNPEVSLDMMAHLWQKAAQSVFEQEHIFVSAFFHKHNMSIFICGNANTIMVGNIDRWKDALMAVISLVTIHRGVRLGSPTFGKNRPSSNF